MSATSSSDTSAAAATQHLTVRCPFCATWNRIDAARVPDRPKCGSCSRPILLDRPLAVDDETFERTIAGSEIPVLVDFYADWCGPCKVMAPVFDDLAGRNQGRVLFLKVNTDHAQRTAASFDIRGIPTTILFKHGSESARQVGAVGRPVLESMIAP